MFRLRQLDLLLTVAVALGLGVLGAFDVVGPPVIAGATLTTLGLLAIGSLHGRVAVHALAGEVSRLGAGAGADRLLRPSTSGLDLDLSTASDVRIVGVTLARTLRNHHVELRQRLAAGATVRVALIAPRESTLAEAARRSTIPDRPDLFEHRLRPTLDLLDALAADAAAGPGRLEVRLLDLVPAYGILAVDVDSPHGSLHVDVYSHRAGVAEPSLALLPDRDPQWYRHFAGELDRLWTVGRPYKTETLEA